MSASIASTLIQTISEVFTYSFKHGDQHIGNFVSDVILSVFQGL